MLGTVQVFASEVGILNDKAKYWLQCYISNEHISFYMGTLLHYLSSPRYSLIDGYNNKNTYRSWLKINISARENFLASFFLIFFGWTWSYFPNKFRRNSFGSKQRSQNRNRSVKLTHLSLNISLNSLPISTLIIINIEHENTENKKFNESMETVRTGILIDPLMTFVPENCFSKEVYGNYFIFIGHYLNCWRISKD